MTHLFLPCEAGEVVRPSGRDGGGNCIDLYPRAVAVLRRSLFSEERGQPSYYLLPTTCYLALICGAIDATGLL